MPRSILRVSIQKLNLTFEPHVQTSEEHALFIFVSFRQVMAVFVFVRIVVSVISLEQTEKGNFSVCRLGHDQHGVKKSHPDMYY